MSADISRVIRSKRDARQAYNQLSRVYDLLAGSSEAPFIDQGLKMLDVQAGESVLEIGPGTGGSLIVLCRQAGVTSLVCGIDLSRGMLHMARNHLLHAGVAQRAHLSGGDGAFLPLASGVFSALFMSFTLELFDTPEIPQVLAECQRVLRPEGRLGVVALSKSVHGSLIVRLYEWLHDRFPLYIDCRPINADTLIHDAGFRIEQRQLRHMWGLPVELVVARKI